MHDVIGMSNMTQGSSPVTFYQDRFGTPNSAINLSNKDFTQVPSGITFDSPEFTISAWVYPAGLCSWLRFIDFVNKSNEGNYISLSLKSSLFHNVFPFLSIYKNKKDIIETMSSKSLVNYQWQLLTVTVDFKKTCIYLNESLLTNSNQFYASKNERQSSVLRTENNSDKENAHEYCSGSSLLDDLRFYNKSLNQTEIIELININYQAIKTTASESREETSIILYKKKSSKLSILKKSLIFRSSI